MIDVLFDKTTRKPTGVCTVPERPSLSQLLKDAREYEDALTLKQKQQAVRAPLCNNPATKDQADNLLALVQPLVDFFPNTCEYNVHTSERYLFDSQQNKAPEKAQPSPEIAVPREAIAVLNPGVIMTSEAHKEYDDDSLFGILDLSDRDYDRLFEAVEELSCIWGKARDCTPAELATNLIFHVVMADDRLRSQALCSAQQCVDRLLASAMPLEQWRSNC